MVTELVTKSPDYSGSPAASGHGSRMFCWASKLLASEIRYLLDVTFTIAMVTLAVTLVMLKKSSGNGCWTYQNLSEGACQEHGQCPMVWISMKAKKRRSHHVANQLSRVTIKLGNRGQEPRIICGYTDGFFRIIWRTSVDQWTKSSTCQLVSWVSKKCNLSDPDFDDWFLQYHFWPWYGIGRNKVVTTQPL